MDLSDACMQSGHLTYDTQKCWSYRVFEINKSTNLRQDKLHLGFRKNRQTSSCCDIGQCRLCSEFRLDHCSSHAVASTCTKLNAVFGTEPIDHCCVIERDLMELIAQESQDCSNAYLQQLHACPKAASFTCACTSC
jgi:hypothetical protein